MHYLIYGTGAVGGYLGGLLNLSGVQTSFLARPSRTETLRKSGIHIKGRSYQAHIPEPHLFSSPEDAFHLSKPDIILLSVKAYDVKAAAEEILTYCSDPIPILCFTNGVGSEELLSSMLPQHEILPATTTTAVQMIDNKQITIERQRGVGLSGSHPSLAAIEQDFGQAGMVVRRYRNPDRMKWSKLLTNIVSNATSAITGWSPREVFSHPGLYQLEIEALRETVRVMHSMQLKPQNLPKVPVFLLSIGIFFPPWIVKDLLGAVVSRGRGTKRPSFHFDIGRGRSEVEWLNGAVEKKGMQLNIPTPANHTLTEIMLKLTADASMHDRFRHRPDQLIREAADAGVPGIRGYNP